MAQTGYTPILIYSSSTGGNAPAAGNLTNSTLGSELAINITDGKLFYKDNANAIQVIGWKTTPTTAGGTGLTSYAAGDLLYYATGTTLSKLAIGANTTILTSSGTAPQWSAASGITVGTATNIAGGAAGSVPYQTGAGATSLLAIGTAYYQLGVNAGGTAPAWQPSATSVLTTQGDLLYASAANTLARLAKNTTATRYLSNTGSSNNPAWAQVDLTNGVTGTLPVGNGGTGATTFTAGQILFGNGTSAINTSSNLFWDSVNNRLGLGSASPNTRFMVVGTGSSVELFHDVASIRFASTPNRTNSWYIGANISDSVDGGFIIGQGANITTGTPRFAVDYLGNTTINSGNLTFGTAAKGINFTANSAAAGMTSQLMNYYEEGTWTPTDASGASLSFSNVSAQYTRIGRMVFAYCRLTYPSTVNGNTAIVGGLPFTIQNIQGARQARITYTSSTATFIFPTPNTTQAVFFIGTTAATNANMSGSDNWLMFTYAAA